MVCFVGSVGFCISKNNCQPTPNDNPISQIETKEYEHQINQMVYKLYGLTNEKITTINQRRKE